MKKTESLSKRENQVVLLLAEGFPKQKIAESLSISKNTVATHVMHIYRKLGVSNSHGAVSKAYRCGILSLD
jgi:DNA-binding CsgD family transcriptional regulator